MTTSFQGGTAKQEGSAKIYEFPARGRFASSSKEDAGAVATSRAAKIGCGGAWYHEQAIQDADRDRAS